MILGIVAVIGVGGLFLLMQSTTPQPTANAALTIQDKSNSNSNNTVSLKELTVTVGPNNEFSFDKSKITVNKNDTVKVTFKNTGRIIHNWVLSKFNASTPVIQPGTNATTEFKATQSGSFEYDCTVPGHKERGMFGNLVVI